MKLMHLFLLLITSAQQLTSEPIAEGEARIFRSAPIGTLATFHPDFAPVIEKFRGCYGKVLPGDDAAEFEWDNGLWAVKSVGNITRSLGSFYHTRLGFFCADGRADEIPLSVGVSKKNVYRPEFKRRSYSFYVAKLSEPGTLIGEVESFDQDPIIYNSKLSRSLIGEDAGQFFLGHDGKLWLRRSFAMHLGSQKLFRIQMRACDYGSPQLCTDADIFIHSVTLTAPRNVALNVLTNKYQIIEWSRPEYGVADEFLVQIIPETIQRGDEGDILSLTVTANHFQEAYRVVTRKRLNERKYFLLVFAINIMEKTPSNPVSIGDIQTNVACESPCNQNNSIPVCYQEKRLNLFVPWLEAPTCICDPGYTGRLCNEIDKCPKALTMTPKGPTLWRETEVNQSSSSYCPYGPKKVSLSRGCIVNFTSEKPEWEGIDFSNFSHCQSKDALLTKIALIGIMSIRDDRPVDGSGLVHLTDNMEDIWFATYADSKVAHNAIELVGKVMQQNLSALNPKTQEEIKRRLLHLLELYADNTVSISGPPLGVDADQISIAVVDVDEQNRKDPVTLNPKLASDRRKPDWSVRVNTRLLDSGDRFSAIFMRNSTFYDENGANANPVLNARIRDRGDKVIFQEPIIQFKMAPYAGKSADQYTCVYFSESENTWKTDGVLSMVSNRTDYVPCASYHLTGFSILLDFDSTQETDPETRFILNLLSWIGCGLSMLGLFITILTYSLFRSLNRDKAGKILLNLCAAMFLLNGVFVLSSLRPLGLFPPGLCISIGVLLHFATLSSLLWMGVEAANMYHMLVQVFAFSEEHFLLKRNLIAWGIPSLIVFITVGINPDFYNDKEDYYCRISKHYPLIQYGTYLAPACLILFANCIVFVMVVKVLMKAASNNSIRKSSRSTLSVKKSHTLAMQVRGALSVMILLGVTWIFGVFAVGPARVPFMYIFCILNSLQGAIIFVVRCLCYAEARNGWKCFLKTGHLKKHRGHQFVTGGTSSFGTLSDQPTTTSEVGPKKRRSEIPRVVVSDTSEPLLSDTSSSSPATSVKTPKRMLGKLRFNSWKYVDDPPSPYKSKGSDSPMGPFTM